MTKSIDITDLVEHLQESFVVWARDYLFELAIAVPGLAWLAWPGISRLTQAALGWGTSGLAKSGILGAFFLNTVLRKRGHARDYVEARERKLTLPAEATDGEFELAELAEMDAFRKFVLLTE